MGGFATLPDNTFINDWQIFFKKRDGLRHFDDAIADIIGRFLLERFRLQTPLQIRDGIYKSEWPSRI